MQICMLVLNYFTRDTRVLKEARTLAQGGHRVTVWALGNGRLPRHEHRNGFEVKRWQSHVEDWQIRPPGPMLIERSFALARLLTKENAEVYHAHDADALIASYWAARRGNARLVYDSHEFLRGLSKRGFAACARWAIHKLTERLVIRQAQAVITVNPSIARQLSDIYGVDATVLMNVQPLTRNLNRGGLHRALGISAAKRIVIYAASFRQGRGLPQLIDSTRYFDDNIILVLMGPDRMGGALHRYAERSNADSRVCFLPPVPQEDVTSYLQDAAIGVVATQQTSLNNYYSLGNKIFHYIAAGLPVAVSNLPEQSRIVQDYGLGVVFDETDPQDIAAKINRALRDPGCYEQLRRNALQAHRSELNWEYESAKLLDLYSMFTQ